MKLLRFFSSLKFTTVLLALLSIIFLAGGHDCYLLQRIIFVRDLDWRAKTAQVRGGNDPCLVSCQVRQTGCSACGFWYNNMDNSISDALQLAKRLEKERAHD